MKAFLILMAIVAYATAKQVPIQPYADRSLSSTIEDAIYEIRDQMPCGFPDAGIPPLAPLKIPHREIDIDRPDFKLHGSIDNFRLNGLNDFDITEMKVNALTSKVTFRFVFNNINVDTLYDLSLVLKKAGFTVNMVGKGPAKFAIKDMNVWGTIKYSIGILSRKLKLKTLEIRTHINDVESDIEGILGEGDINHKLNDVLAEAVEVAVNENEDYITETIEHAALPMINDVLDEKPLNELIGGGGGGGGGDGGEGGQGGEGGGKQACIPPEY